MRVGWRSLWPLFMRGARVCTDEQMAAAWDLLPPGGFLVGDDFDRFWPSVQQSVIEFVSQRGHAAFDPPAAYARAWPFRWNMRYARAHADGGAAASEISWQPHVLLKGSQWILRKATTAHCNRSDAPPAEPISRRSVLRCCLNGWANSEGSRCRPAAPPLQQNSCNVHFGKGINTGRGGEKLVGVGRCRPFACLSRSLPTSLDELST